MFFLSVLLAFAPLPVLTVSVSPSECGEIAQTFVSENVTVNLAQFVPANTTIQLPQDVNTSLCDTPTQLTPVDICRVTMNIETSSRSSVFMEAWLPTANWSGRFLSTGNGGLGGCIQYIDIAYGVQFGFATVGANNGHNGTRGIAFLDNPDVVDDFAFRSMHTGVVVGKAITQTFFQQNITKSYYLGCSTGGRQGVKSVQMFPDDFDGVVAGAPAIAFNNLISWSGNFLIVQGTAGDPTFLDVDDWDLVHAEILRQCDAIDGFVDGIVEDPLLCNFRPEALLCGPGNTTNCLTAPQVAAARLTYSPYYGLEGELLYPRMQPGSEALAAVALFNGQPFAFTSDWFQFAVFNDPSFNPSNFTRADAEFAKKKNPGNISSFEGDLSAFRNSGGKLLHYHGLADGLISSDNSARFYDRVVRTMALPSSALDDFYRFFRISGMSHCANGDGAWQIGQTLPSIDGIEPDIQNNILLRIVDWVENGNAPDTVTGTKFVNDTPALGVSFVRNHCKYPARNVCVNSTLCLQPEGWECVGDAF